MIESRERIFLKRNLEAAEAKGTEGQQIDMAYLVSDNARMLGELGDFIGGRRVPKNHPHHTPNHVTDAIIDGIVIIIKLRKEIESTYK